ncbi:MAG: ORF6N domain-containing protein [Magnetococcales bacterium]|nr:ORF6N domain-containing protein [Magnetococcales bacterium]
MSNQTVTLQTIQSMIIVLPGREPFMLAQDLAAIYETEPKYIARAVKRNTARFPDDFVFQLTDEEVEILRCQIGTAKFAKIRSNPLGFFQTGANMLSVVLNSSIAVERSKQIVRAFTAMEVHAANDVLLSARETLRKARQAERHAQIEWQKNRAIGKVARRDETDTVKVFIGYAKGQGSKNAEMYYLNLSAMLNRELFGLEPKNTPDHFRDTLDAAQLGHVRMAEIAVGRALTEGMEKTLPYKAIFLFAKERVKMLVQMVGRPHPLMLGDPANTLTLPVQVVA